MKWMTKEKLDKMDERRLAKNDPGKYKKLNKEIRKMCKNANEEYLEDCCKEIEELEKKDLQIICDKVVCATLKKKKSLTGCIRDDDG